MPIPPPTSDEYAPFHEGYIGLAREADPLELLRNQPVLLRQVVSGLSEAESLYRYAPGKWSIKEVLGHITDNERVLAYRLMRIARGDATPLPGYEEGDYVAAADFDDRPLADLAEDFVACRASTIRLVESLNDDVWSNEGVANNLRTTARAILYIIVGHVVHHFRLLQDRYGVQGIG
jgi:hypothetical protein